MSLPRVLLMLPENPFDPTNGAARSMRTIAEMLCPYFSVRAIGTAATERPIASADLWNRLQIGADCKQFGECYEWSFHSRGIEYRLVDTPQQTTRTWRNRYTETALNQLLAVELRERRPEILFTYGGQAADLDRYQIAARKKVQIVFGLRNYGYLTFQTRAMFQQFAGVLTSSQFLTDLYRDVVGIESTPLPLPISYFDVKVLDSEPYYFTAVNPTKDKGLMILARVFGELSTNRPDIPLMVVESHAVAGELEAAARSIGYELTGKVEILPWHPQPKSFLAITKVLLAPSVWEEPAGRVVAEAIYNGIPAIVTDRGGLAETANGGGFVLPLSLKIRPDLAKPVDQATARPWIELITQLHDSPGFYEAARQRAWQAAALYHPNTLLHRYAEFFEKMRPPEALQRAELRPAEV